MKPIKETIPLDEARQLIAEACKPITRTERVRLVDANGRVAAADVQSTRDVPPFARAGMDGFAVRAEDTFGASRYDARVLRVVGKVYTGQVPATAVDTGTAIEIATGAPMPQGADAVVMVEETELSGNDVRVLTPVYPRQNVGRQGADIVVGQTVIARGEVLNPSRIGALAALGAADVEVYAKPTVAILSTGNEIADPGQELQPGQIYDINKYTLTTIIQEHGGAVAVPFSTAQDTLEALEQAIDACSACDVLVFSGGSSVGERDLILDVMKKKGEIVFHGIAVKPGKPTVFGTINGKPMFGMPGYPTSCLSNAYMLVVPALRAIAHLGPRHTATVTLPVGQRIVSTTGRHQFYTVRIVDGQAMPAFKASGDITSMSQADGYIEIPAQTDIVEKGEVVNVTLF
ncbi:MAG TPA: gephyrin-like molybdotransferase Glp [Vicinamibacterales bacterium]|nr:gephyrin-like molybdotransferase Glp [Vicinamibacterales bacterium]